MKRVLAPLVFVVCACAGSSKDNPSDAGPMDCTDEGAHQCAGSTYQVCRDKQWMTEMDCTVACDHMLGCVQCSPGGSFCKDGNVWSCNPVGDPGAEVQACMGASVCVGGA